MIIASNLVNIHYLLQLYIDGLVLYHQRSSISCDTNTRSNLVTTNEYQA